MKADPTEYTLRTHGPRAEHAGDGAPSPWPTATAARSPSAISADVEDGLEQDAGAPRSYNDTPCVLLNIRKQSGTNTVEVATAAEGAAGSAAEHACRRTTACTIVRDQSVFIEARSIPSKSTCCRRRLLAAVVVFFFLANIRATIIAALSIPTSIIAAFAIVKYMGFTLNSLTLLALTLSVGIVIDDAIVVMENIFGYIEEKKYTP